MKLYILFGTILALFLAGCVQPELPNNDSIDVCTLEYMPVCGVDGNTYSNDCVAQSQGVEIAYEGECRQEEELLFHAQGILTYEFVVDKPTPCHSVNVTTMVQESFPPTVVISAQVQSPAEDVICAQVISPETINGTVEITKPFYARIVVDSQTITSAEFLEE